MMAHALPTSRVPQNVKLVTVRINCQDTSPDIRPRASSINSSLTSGRKTGCPSALLETYSRFKKPDIYKRKAKRHVCA